MLPQLRGAFALPIAYRNHPDLLIGARLGVPRQAEDGQPLDRAALVVAAWALYLRGVDEHGKRYAIVDPRAEHCQALVADDAGLTARVLGQEAIFGTALAASPAFAAAFERCLASLREAGVSATLRALLRN